MKSRFLLVVALTMLFFASNAQTVLIDIQESGGGCTLATDCETNFACFDLIVSVKEVNTFKVKIPSKNNNPASQLTYMDLKGIDWKNRKRLSEPYLTSLIEFIQANITSSGVPDYTLGLSKSLCGNLMELIKNEQK